jgi:hypothetical protein
LAAPWRSCHRLSRGGSSRERSTERLLDLVGHLLRRLLDPSFCVHSSRTASLLPRRLRPKVRSGTVPTGRRRRTPDRSAASREHEKRTRTTPAASGRSAGVRRDLASCTSLHRGKDGPRGLAASRRVVSESLSGSLSRQSASAVAPPKDSRPSGVSHLDLLLSRATGPVGSTCPTRGLATSSRSRRGSPSPTTGPPCPATGPCRTRARP